MAVKSVCSRLLVVVCVLLIAGAARANTVDTSFNFLIGTGDFYGGSGPFAQCSGFANSCTSTDSQSVSGSYQLFDPTLGTLNGVTVKLTSIFPLGAELFNFSGTGSVTASSTYNVGGIFTGTIDAIGYTCTDFCDDYPSATGTVDNTLNRTYTAPLADLSTYLGSGTANMTIAQSITANGTSTGDYEVRGRSNELFTQGWRGTVDVQYDYTPAVTAAPEPSSAAMMFGGLALLAGFVRRKL